MIEIVKEKFNFLLCGDKLKFAFYYTNLTFKSKLKLCQNTKQKENFHYSQFIIWQINPALTLYRVAFLKYVKAKINC